MNTSLIRYQKLSVSNVLIDGLQSDQSVLYYKTLNVLIVANKDL